MRQTAFGVIVATIASVSAIRATEPVSSSVADAAMRGDIAAVRALVQSGADVNTPEGDGMTALHWAAEHGDADLAALLLARGASVTAETRIGRHTPLHVAARTGRAAVVRALVDAHSA